MIWFLMLAACTGGDAPAEHRHAAAEGAPRHAAHHDDAGSDHATMTHRFDDAEKWAAVFDDPERDAWQRPSDVVAAMGVMPGQVVADLGAGTGYLVPHLAKAVGPEGRVIAIEVEDTLAAHMQKRFTDQKNVEVRTSTAGASGLVRSEVDHVVLLDVYHHISDRVAYFGALRRAVRPGGTLTVVDFDPTAEGAHGPPASHRILLDNVNAELTEAGWVSTGPVSESLEEQYIGRFGVGRVDTDVAWLAARLDGPGVQLVDVRTPAEFSSGHIPGARNVPLGALQLPLDDVDKAQPVVVVCEVGGRSSRAATQLAEAGYQAINLTGGTSAWTQAGHPVEQ